VSENTAHHIVTVTPAPAIDWTVTVSSFALGAVNRATTSTREASGKGVNVAWALHRAGIATRAIVPAGGNTAEFMATQFTAGGLGHEIIPIAREVRTNITLISPGESTKINEPGTPLDDAEWGSLSAAVELAAKSANIIALCGSLPSGSAADVYGRLIESVRARAPHVRIALDTSGEPLNQSVSAGPDLIKPNVDELAELTGRPLRSLGEVREAADHARELGAGAVLASLGGDGSMLVTADGAWVARAHDIPVVNTVGAGDALLAGFLADGNFDSESLRNAALWASSAVASPTTLFPVRDEYSSRITVRDFATESTLASTALSEPAAPPATTPVN
jgi:1-phosphofructokinase